MKNLSHFKSVPPRQRRRGLSRVMTLVTFSLLFGLTTVPAATATPPANLQVSVATMTPPLSQEASVVLAASAPKNCSTKTALAKRPELRYGSRGTCVSVLQQNLLNRGYFIGAKASTGTFLSGTDAAVRRFQKDNKLVRDGIVGPITWKKLGLSYSKPKTTKPKLAPKGKPATLTFDDCPSSLAVSNQTLRAARDAGIHLRLYPTGDCIKAKRFDIATARKYGHTVCSHSKHHTQLTKLKTVAAVKAEMSIPQLKNVTCGRPPYGAVNATVRTAFKQMGMSLDLWDVDTNDWRGKTRSQIVNYTIQNTSRGDTVLMHFHRGGFDATALKQMKAGLAKRGVAVK